MNEFDATEQAYRNGYEAGKADALKWISVNAHLPETIPVTGCNTAYSEAVVVLTSGRKVLTAVFDGTDFICDYDFWECDDDEVITHWKSILPLPQPPENGV